MNSVMVATIKQSLASKTDAEIVDLWKSDDSEREGEGSEALRQLFVDRGLRVPKRVKFTKATGGDLVLSVLFPGLGLILGLVALMRGQTRRGITMLAIGVVVLLVVIVASLGNSGPNR